jgi:hypothetical protein
MVFGNQSDSNQNSTFAPLGNVTVNATLDIVEINDRKKNKTNDAKYYVLYPSSQDGDLNYNLHAYEPVIVNTSKNCIAGTLIKCVSSFNDICVPRNVTIGAGDATEAAKRINRWVEEHYTFIGISATESFLTANGNDQTQKPAVYTAGTIDVVNNNFGDRIDQEFTQAGGYTKASEENCHIKVGDRLEFCFPKIFCTGVPGNWKVHNCQLSANEFSRREYGKPQGKQLMVIKKINTELYFYDKEYFQNFLNEYVAIPPGDANRREKLIPIYKSLAIGMASSMTRQAGVAYSNAAPGQIIVTNLSHKTIL